MKKLEPLLNSKDVRQITMQEGLNYEIYSSWIACLISFSLGQDLMARYLVWKTKRKYRRYEKYKKLAEILLKTKQT